VTAPRNPQGSFSDLIDPTDCLFASAKVSGPIALVRLNEEDRRPLLNPSAGFQMVGGGNAHVPS
jgi:hypothetical protein